MKDSVSGFSIGAIIVLVIFMYMLCKDNENMTSYKNMTDDDSENITSDDYEGIPIKQWMYLYNSGCCICYRVGDNLLCQCTKDPFAPYEMTTPVPHTNYATVDLTKCKKPYTFNVNEGKWNENITISCMK